jgi:alpha-glucosidase (family GH31 glycosyl hydrolase)
MISLLQTKVTYNYLNNNNEAVRPFILSRSTSLGSGKYTYHWLGDNLSTFANLKNSISGIFNFNIFGIPFTGSDICGFMDNASKDLCIRWYNLGIFYPFMRNHNFKKAKDQYPWSFNDSDKKYDIISIIRRNINIRYSLLRYIYSQLFLISLNEKGSFFKPLMFEFPEEKISYEDIESRIMFGEAFLICTFYDNNENEKLFEFPNSNFNKYPEGTNILNYGDNNKAIKLSGELNKVHIFLRGGFIVPYQDTFNKYILNSMKLKEDKLNLIININNLKESKGVVFFDNDGVDTIKKKEYIRVDLVFSEKKLNIYTNKNNLVKYDFNDHILGKIEILRIDEIFKINKENEKDITFKLNIVYKDNLNKKKEIRKGNYEKNNNKVIFKISKDDENISIFDIKEIIFK